jgi:hypothetical protein
MPVPTIEFHTEKMVTNEPCFPFSSIKKFIKEQADHTFTKCEDFFINDILWNALHLLLIEMLKACLPGRIDFQLVVLSACIRTH